MAGTREGSFRGYGKSSSPSLKLDQNVSERELDRKDGRCESLKLSAGRCKWEGESYRIDVARPEIERMIQIRQQQGQPSLETATQAGADCQVSAITEGHSRRRAQVRRVNCPSLSEVLIPPKLAQDELPERDRSALRSAAGPRNRNSQPVSSPTHPRSRARLAATRSGRSKSPTGPW